jgi:hypothetical protein
MGHGLCVCFCVCGETTKNKEESKNVNRTWSISRWNSNPCYFGDTGYKQDTVSVSGADLPQNPTFSCVGKKSNNTKHTS